jgi:hypothetical protein
MRAEFANGIKYVRDCIPPPMDGLVSVDWRYLPASTLGGDTIGYIWWTTITLPFTSSTSRYYLSVANVIRAGAFTRGRNEAARSGASQT